MWCLLHLHRSGSGEPFQFIWAGASGSRRHARPCTGSPIAEDSRSRGDCVVSYRSTVDGIESSQLQEGFFEGWMQKPSPETHLRLLRESDEIVIAIDEDTGQVVGFVTAITDRVLSAYIPLLEVLPAYRGQGIASELVRRVLAQLGHIYMVDVLCDEPLQAFYARFGMMKASGAMIRNFDAQSGCGTKPVD